MCPCSVLIHISISFVVDFEEPKRSIIQYSSQKSITRGGASSDPFCLVNVALKCRQTMRQRLAQAGKITAQTRIIFCASFCSVAEKNIKINRTSLVGSKKQIDFSIREACN